MRRFIDIVSGTESSAPRRENLLALLEAKAYQDMLRALENMVQTLNNENAAISAKDDRSTDGINPASLGAALWLLEVIKKYAKPLRQDRSVWVTREFRLLLTRGLMEEVYGEGRAKVEKLFKKYKADYERATGQALHIPAEYDIETSRDAIYRMMETLDHFKGVPFQPLQDMVFEPSMNFSALYDSLKAVEERFIQRSAGTVALEEGDEIILKFPAKSEDEPPRCWVLLNRASCDKEANAMGHCGNSPRSHTQDRIISLREFEFTVDGIDRYRPCLTFILQADGHLGEMKGRANQKPAAHYHDEIEALLRLPIIKGIRGGGYAAQNNFALGDMQDEQRLALVKDKPELLTPRERYTTFGLDEKMLNTIADIYRSRGFAAVMKYYDEIKITDEDRATVAQYHPEIRTPQEKYKSEGLTDALINEIRLGCEEVARNRESWGYGRSEGHQWFDNDSYFTKGFTPASMTEEDRHKLFTAVPKAMSLAEEYDFGGLTERVVETIEEIYKESGPKAAYEGNDMDFDKFEEEDKKVLAEKGIATFSYLLSLKGPDESFVTAVQNAVDTWGYDYSSAFEFSKEIRGYEKGCFVVGNWSDVDDLINDEGSDEFKAYNKETHFDSGYYPDDDDSYVENFDDVIGFVNVNVLRVHAEKLLRDEYDVPEGEPDEDEHDEDFVEKMDDLSRWGGIYDVLNEFDEEVTDAVKRAVSHGLDSGTEAAIYEEKYDALKRAASQCDVGKLVFGMGKTSAGNDFISWDDPVNYVMTPEEIATFLDNADDDFYLTYKETGGNEKGIEFSVPYYGFTGFDEVAAFEDFCGNHNGELSDELTEALVSQNPHIERAELKKYTPAKMRKLISEMDKEMGKLAHSGLEELSDEKLVEYFTTVLKQYYGEGNVYIVA